jgi:hypothetical protein
MGACVAHPVVVAPACEQPAPLDGNWNPKTPGYIVMFTEDVNDARSLTYQLADKHGFMPDSVYGAIKGFSVSELSPRALAGLRCEPKIRGVSFNQPTRISRNAL